MAEVLQTDFICFFFFFQAEDGIRDWSVTGVQTCALPIYYKIFDLTKQTPLVTTKKLDQSGKKWDTKDETGLRYEPTARTVEVFKDVKPIFDRSCVACHSQKLDKPAAGLVLDDERWVSTQNPAGLGFGITVPGTYARLAA